MRLSSLRFALIFALAAAIPGLRAQTVPTTINYQGRLTDNSPSQLPVTATVQMQFAIYDAASGGTRLWQEPAANNTGTPILVSGGIFGYVLGNAVALPASVFSGATSVRYLQVTLNPAGGAEILTPRQLITATGYAGLAQNANNAVNATNAATATVATTANNATALGGVAAASWQRALSTPACPAGQLLKTVNADGTTVCQAPSLSETDPKVGSAVSGRVPRWNGAALVDGSMVDIGSNVGIGTAAPAGAFEVSTLAETLDLTVDSASVSFSTLTLDKYQSFTQVTTGQLSRLELKWTNTVAYSGTLRIYAGAGTGGALLHTQAITAPITTGFVNITLSPSLAVSAGSVYTWLVAGSGLTGNRLLNDNNNIYTGGSADGTVLRDYLFHEFVLPATPLSNLFVNDGQVGIGTASPAEKLSVYGNVEVTRPGFGIKFSNGSLQTTAVTLGNYILNGTTAQAGANFNIAGNGTVGGAMSVGTTLSVGVRFVTCTVTTPTQDCACAAGETIVTGGGFHAGGDDIIRESRPVSITTWRLTCTDGLFGADINCGGMNIICDRRAP